jgi:hypothetical protein
MGRGIDAESHPAGNRESGAGELRCEIERGLSATRGTVSAAHHGYLMIVQQVWITVGIEQGWKIAYLPQ